jgi:hypothetical protein
MLDDSDTDIVKRWLAKALGDSKSGKGKRAELAERCGVRPQAVSGWLKTGRITKKNLETATTYFGHGPSFTKTVHHVAERRGRYLPEPWPFKTLDEAMVRNLRPDELARVEGAWIYAAHVLGFSLAKPAAA